VEQVSRLQAMACWRQYGSFAAKLSRLDSCEDRKVVCWCRIQASLMAGSMRQVWALQHHTGAQYSAVECSSTQQKAINNDCKNYCNETTRLSTSLEGLNSYPTLLDGKLQLTCTCPNWACMVL